MTARKARARGSKRRESRTSCFFAWPFPLSRDRARQIATASFVMAGARGVGEFRNSRCGREIVSRLDEHGTLENVTSALVIGQFIFEASLSIHWLDTTDIGARATLRSSAGYMYQGSEHVSCTWIHLSDTAEPKGHIGAYRSGIAEGTHPPSILGSKYGNSVGQVLELCRRTLSQRSRQYLDQEPRTK